MAEVKLDGIFKKIQTLIKNRLRFQVPVAKGTKKKPGGELKASIDVKVYQNERGVQFKSSYLEYGKFTDEGTKPYWKGPQPNTWASMTARRKNGRKKWVLPSSGTNVNTSSTFKHCVACASTARNNRMYTVADTGAGTPSPDPNQSAAGGKLSNARAVAAVTPCTPALPLPWL